MKLARYQLVPRGVWGEAYMSEAADGPYASYSAVVERDKEIERLKAEMAAYRKEVRDQAVVVCREPGEDFTSGVACALCGDGLSLEDFENERGSWTDEQWREACPHAEGCVAGRAGE